MSLGVTDASSLSSMRASFPAWLGMIPFLLPVSKNVCNPLCLNDFITINSVTHRVTAVNAFSSQELCCLILCQRRNTKITEGAESRWGDGIGLQIRNLLGSVPATSIFQSPLNKATGEIAILLISGRTTLTLIMNPCRSRAIHGTAGHTLLLPPVKDDPTPANLGVSEVSVSTIGIRGQTHDGSGCGRRICQLFVLQIQGIPHASRLRRPAFLPGRFYRKPRVCGVTNQSLDKEGEGNAAFRVGEVYQLAGFEGTLMAGYGGSFLAAYNVLRIWQTREDDR